MTTNEGLDTGCGTVVSLSERMSKPPMQTPHSRPPLPRSRPKPPAEVLELAAVWVSTDNLLNGLQRQAEMVMRCLLSAMGPDDARDAVQATMRLAITEALKAEIKGSCGND